MAGLSPTKKVQAGGASGALAIVVIYIAHELGLDMDALTASAFATLLTLAGAYAKNEE